MTSDTAAPERTAEETAWVIEDAGSMPSSPMYLSGYDSKRPGSWSSDSNDAIRFARKIDAERAWSCFDDGEGVVRICEHIWGGERLDRASSDTEA